MFFVLLWNKIVKLILSLLLLRIEVRTADTNYLLALRRTNKLNRFGKLDFHFSILFVLNFKILNVKILPPEIFLLSTKYKTFLFQSSHLGAAFERNLFAARDSVQLVFVGATNASPLANKV